MTQWVDIDHAVLQAAQDRIGLSNEKLAAQLYIASKTWERWKKRGAVPRVQLARLASVLHLEFDEPEPIEVRLAPTTVGRTQATLQYVDALALADWMDGVEERLGRVEEAARLRAERTDALLARLEQSGVLPAP